MSSTATISLVCRHNTTTTGGERNMGHGNRITCAEAKTIAAGLYAANDQDVYTIKEWRKAVPALRQYSVVMTSCWHSASGSTDGGHDEYFLPGSEIVVVCVSALRYFICVKVCAGGRVSAGVCESGGACESDGVCDK